MQSWKICKNNQPAGTIWQLYYVTADHSARRFLGIALDYPTAAALRDALADAEIRNYVDEHDKLASEHNNYLNGKLYAHTQANMAVYQRMLDLPLAYGGKKGAIYEALIHQAAMSEE